MSYPFESLLEVDENMTEVWLMLHVFPTVLRLSIICGTASCSECYSICFSALISSCGLSLLRMSFNVTLVGRLMRLIFSVVLLLLKVSLRIFMTNGSAHGVSYTLLQNINTAHQWSNRSWSVQALLVHYQFQVTFAL